MKTMTMVAALLLVALVAGCGSYRLVRNDAPAGTQADDARTEDARDDGANDGPNDGRTLAPGQTYSSEEQAYRQGMNDALGQLENMLRRRNAMGSTVAYTPVWRPPVIQKVWIPSTVSPEGMFVEGHYEYCVIDEGGWAVSDNDGGLRDLEEMNRR